MNPRNIDKLLSDLRRELENLYGPRLRGLYLFGSYARNEADAESDVDVLIVLGEYSRYGAEVDRVSEAVSQLSLEHGVTITVVFVRESQWASGDSPFLRNARSEAMTA